MYNLFIKNNRNVSGIYQEYAMNYKDIEKMIFLTKNKDELIEIRADGRVRFVISSGNANNVIDISEYHLKPRRVRKFYRDFLREVERDNADSLLVLLLGKTLKNIFKMKSKYAVNIFYKSGVSALIPARIVPTDYTPTSLVGISQKKSA